MSFSSSRIKQGGSAGWWNEATGSFGKVVQLRSPAERNVGSVTSHAVRWDRSACRFQAFCVCVCVYVCVCVSLHMSFFKFSFLPRLFYEDHVWSRSYSRAAAPAAVVWFSSSVLQLLCSHQRRCFPGAPLKVDQHRGPLFVKVPSDSHVIFSRKGELSARFQTWKCQSKSRTIFIPLLEFIPSLQMPASSLKKW